MHPGPQRIRGKLIFYFCFLAYCSGNELIGTAHSPATSMPYSTMGQWQKKNLPGRVLNSDWVMRKLAFVVSYLHVNIYIYLCVHIYMWCIWIWLVCALVWHFNCVCSLFAVVYHFCCFALYTIFLSSSSTSAAVRLCPRSWICWVGKFSASSVKFLMQWTSQLCCGKV